MSLVGVQALTSFPAELAKMDARATRLLELQEAVFSCLVRRLVPLLFLCLRCFLFVYFLICTFLEK